MVYDELKFDQVF